MNDMLFVNLNRRLALSTAALALVTPLSAFALPKDASASARQLVRWATATADHQGLPFAVIDKPAARIHVFSARGEWMSSSPVLLGAALGDRSAPDIGQRPLSQIRPDERTTPAGRFVTEPGRNLKGDDIVWIDYEAAVSLHRVRSVSAAERRHQRLASQGAGDKRISYGCVNAPEAFYNQFISPLFGQARGVIYVLPDTEPFATFFVAANAYQ
ncbi:hypothetical protein LJR129_002997 [Acidovorax sp. LjRoot129]|uniref:hypothetical protein n=1 Tax=Acidovorax sp. LjRoot129 TaxID=3342260 RepID=UPI003ECD12BC